MAGNTSSINDNDASLVKKQATNWYNYAVDNGITGLNPPSWNDNKTELLKKIAYYTAAIADN